MNLFRSEGHVRNWSGYKAGSEPGLVKLADIVDLFSSKFFTRRMDPDYVSHMHAYEAELMEKKLSKMGAFWQPPEM